MRKNNDNNANKRIVGIILLFTVIVLIGGGVIGKRQNDEFIADGLELARAQQYADEEMFAEAVVILAKMVEKYPNSAPLLYDYAACLAELGRYEQAIEYYQRAQTENPNLARGLGFLLEAGTAFYYANEYEQAAKYLHVAKLMSADDSTTQYINSILNNIEDSLVVE
ncbi:MAG: tetratricopeptide repeat protein [Peptococcia bacterium]